MTPRLIVAFWKTVSDCLVEFFDVEDKKASAMVLDLRAKIEEESTGLKKADRDLIYHSEPIHIASDLVGKEPKRDTEFYKKYQSIQKRNLKHERARTLLSSYSLGDVSVKDIKVKAPSSSRATRPLTAVTMGKKVAGRSRRSTATQMVNTR
jgi:hypothetical protein